MIFNTISDVVFCTFTAKVSVSEYHKLRKDFSKFYRRYFELVSIYMYNTGLRSLLQQGMSVPEFFGDLLYNCRKMVGNQTFLINLKKICDINT